MGLATCLAPLMLLLAGEASLAQEAPRSARGAAAAEALRGVYLVANIAQGDSLAASDSRHDFSNAMANRTINGAYLKEAWNDLEPADGVFAWGALDRQVRLAEAAGKKIALGVQAGTATPPWVYGAGAAPFRTITREAANDNFCRPQEVPIPWDPVFLRQWTDFVRAFGAHYADDPRLVEVKITGINITTHETSMPHSIGQTRTKTKGSRAGTPCALPNDDANWVAAGYTQGKVFDAWKRIANAFAVAFPRQALVVMTSTHSMPSIGSDGQLDPTGAAEGFASNAFFDYGAATYGKRFAAAQNGWRPHHLDEGVLSFAARTGNPFGWQPSWPIKCREGGARTKVGEADCTERKAVEELFQTGLASRPTYLELLHPLTETNAYDDLIKQAYDQVMGR